MSTLEDLENDGEDERNNGEDRDGKLSDQNDDAKMQDVLVEKTSEHANEEFMDSEILHSSTRDIKTRRRLLDNEMRIMKSEYQRLTHEQAAMKEKIKDNLDKIENNRCDSHSKSKNFLRQKVANFALQTAALPCWKRRGAPRPRSGERSRGRRGKY